MLILKEWWATINFAMYVTPRESKETGQPKSITTS